MEIAAILTTASSEGSDPAEPRARKNGKSQALVPNVRTDILGLSLLQRTSQRLRKLGIETAAVILENRAVTQVLPTRPTFANNFTSAWEQAVGSCITQGVEHLLLLRTSVYSDLDLGELLRFHRERGSALTQAYASDGPLDIAVVDTHFLRGPIREYRKKLSALIPTQERFVYEGYVNRLRKPQDFYRLMQDGLYRRCNLRPLGTEISEDIWVGDGAEVDKSCSMKGPLFLGAASRIAACCAITGGSAIEKNCQIDCGTTVADSWVLQGTYVGVGLSVRQSVVSNQRIFHLERQAEVAILDPRLIGIARKVSLIEPPDQAINTA